MPIGIQLLQHPTYRYRGPVWVDDIDPIWLRHLHLNIFLKLSLKPCTKSDKDGLLSLNNENDV